MLLVYAYSVTFRRTPPPPPRPPTTRSSICHSLGPEQPERPEQLLVTPDRTTERPTIRANQCSAFNCESVDSLLNSSTTVFRRVLSTYRVIIDRLWAVSPYIFANCCSVGRSVVPSFRLVLGKASVLTCSFERLAP